MKSQNQTGFAVVETLLVVIILALIGGTGYYVWHAQKKTNDSLNAVSNTSTSVAVPKKASAARTGTTVSNDQAIITSAVQNYNRGFTAGQKAVVESGGVVKITHNNDGYALGTWSFQGGEGGSQWFAQKTGGTWLVISQGMDGHCDELAAHGLTSWDETCTDN